ncbi:MAG: leucine-rich repeat domain-containing protein [Planctomycetales bacterium]|nr:leucine-rich repeat domain-containing protein [Planctomycetales bacterium]MBN8628138.1 leucine-rich repeat domain-containing protein [Planctomycetota bacterium]
MFACLMLVAAVVISTRSAAAVTLRELVDEKGPPKLFVAVKGVEMPTQDQTNNFNAGDRALLLSEHQLTDITGISTIEVNDEGVVKPIAEVKSLLIYLNHNLLTSIPDEVGTMHNVRFFYGEHNPLSAIPDAFAKMKSLEGIYFGHCEFTEIPPFVFDMTALKKLQFCKNRIRVLPDAIGNLVELRHLNVSDNRIGRIPESMSKLTKLRVCDLSDNPFPALPEAFGKVQIVNQLRVKNCPITTLPAGFATMRATIDATGTKIDPASLPPQLRDKLNTEKPPGSKEWDKMIVLPKKKGK